MTNLIIGTGGDVPVVRNIIWPSNSHKSRALKEKDVLTTPKEIEIKDVQDYYYVRIKYIVWPEIYGKQLPIHFPTLEASMKFAQGNCTESKPLTRVYTPDNELVGVFKYRIHPRGNYVEKV